MKAKLKYGDYHITTGGLGYEYVHNSYGGVFEYDGETGEPSEYDHRAGTCKTIEQCIDEIDELEEQAEEKAQERAEALSKINPDGKLDITDYSDSTGGEVIVR